LYLREHELIHREAISPDHYSLEKQRKMNTEIK